MGNLIYVGQFCSSTIFGSFAELAAISFKLNCGESVNEDYDEIFVFVVFSLKCCTINYMYVYCLNFVVQTKDSELQRQKKKNNTLQ